MPWRRSRGLQLRPGLDAKVGITRSVADLGPQAIVLAGVLAQAGLHRDALAIARSITDPEWQAGALAEVTRAMADYEHQPPRPITSFMTYLGSEEKIAGAVVRTGDHGGHKEVPEIFNGLCGLAGESARCGGGGTGPSR